MEGRKQVFIGEDALLELDQLIVDLRKSGIPAKAVELRDKAIHEFVKRERKKLERIQVN